MLSRLHSAPAAPQSREGGQRQSYFGSEENDGTNIYRLGSGELCPLNGSSGDDADAAGGKFPSQLLVDDKRDAEPSVAPAANGGRRKGRRANLARSSLDMGLIHAGENDWNVQGQSARDHSLEQAENRGRGARGKNRPARDTDHLGGRNPRPPVGGPAATAGNHLQVCFISVMRRVEGLWVSCLYFCDALAILFVLEFEIPHLLCLFLLMFRVHLGGIFACPVARPLNAARRMSSPLCPVREHTPCQVYSAKRRKGRVPRLLGSVVMNMKRLRAVTWMRSQLYR